MTDNLARQDDLPLTPEAFAAMLRPAGRMLVRIALRAQDGDWERAKVMLRPALEAIGAIPYEAGRGRRQWGQVS